MEHGIEPERVFGVLAVRSECAVGGCEAHTVAALPVEISGNVGVWWLCADHADVMPWLDGLTGKRGPGTAYNLSATCRYNSLGADLPPCGAAADYLAITGLRGAGSLELAVTSLCQRHATALPIY